MVVEKADQTAFEGDSGGYYVWSNEKTPLLSDYKLGAGKLLLHPLGFAIPHYADANKIGFVVEGVYLYLLPYNILFQNLKYVEIDCMFNCQIFFFNLIKVCYYFGKTAKL